MPVIKNYFKDLAININYTYGKYQDNLPKILTTFPITNGTSNVDPSLKEMTIVFDRPMGSGWSFGFPDLGKDYFPIESVIGWDETFTQLKIRVKLKPNWEYGMYILSQGLKSKQGYPFQRLLFNFKTK
jgi:hypothetical protein